MATTSPDNLYSPDAADPYALTQDLGAMQSSVQDALIQRANAYRGTSAQRNAFTNAPVGTIWSDTNGDQLVYKRGASSWEPVSPPVEDTGWIAASLAGGWGSSSGRTVGYRLVGGVVFLRGQASKEPVDTTTIFTLPSGFRPGMDGIWTVPSTTTDVGKFTVDPTGRCRLAVPPPNNRVYVGLDGVSFPVG